MKNYILLYAVLLLLCNCKRNTINSSNPKAGTITYKIKYQDINNKHINSNLLPEEMELIFSNNEWKYIIKGKLNSFSLAFYSKGPTDSCSTVFKLFGNTLFYQIPNKQNILLFNNIESAKIEYIHNDLKEISGFKCKKANIILPNNQPYTIYYTDDISLKRPNRNSPFTEIPGVIMEFEVKYKSIKFLFSAVKFNSTLPSESQFDLPKDAKYSSQEEIEGFLETLINISQ